MILSGKLISLRPATVTDAKFIYQLMHQDSTRRDLKWKASSSIPSIKEWIETAKHKKNFIISLKTKPIGTINLFGLDKDKKEATIGWAVIDENHRGEGHFSDALKTIIKYAFEKLKLENLKVETYSEHVIRAAEHAGMKRKVELNIWR